MEQAFGISPGGPLPEPATRWVTRQSVQRRFTSQIHNRLSLLHTQKQASSVPGLGDPSMPEPVQPVAPDRGREAQGLTCQVIPCSQLQSVGPGEYLHHRTQIGCGLGVMAVRLLLHQPILQSPLRGVLKGFGLQGVLPVWQGHAWI